MKQVIKQLTFVYFFSYLFAGCVNKSTPTATSWRQKHLHRFYFNLPDNYILKVSSKDSIEATILGDSTSINVVQGYSIPETLVANAVMLKQRKIKSTQKELIIYLTGLNKGSYVISVWDTVAHFDIAGARRYNSITFVSKNVSFNQKRIFEKIFDSVYKQ